ncbi:hypothetical protein [Echinicola soli]|uniref:hypothetical protein n=1 Tax=Echinicola soli TaxID=2591634 RepID=UPI00143DCAC7|nr:hypothetical protein [Echinicola soli]
MFKKYPEYKTPAMQFEEETSDYSDQRKTGITLYIDGTDQTLQREIEKLKMFNEQLKKL